MAEEKSETAFASVAAEANGDEAPAGETTPAFERMQSEELLSEDEGSCGWCCCVPKWLQFFNRPRWFTMFLCLFVVCQSMTVSGMNGVVIPTIERRYKLTSERSGLILSVYDIAAASLVIPISYFGEKAHKPRWIGLGCLILGIGSLIFALPHALSGNFEPDNLQTQEYCGADLNHSAYTTPVAECQKGSANVYGVLVLGQLLIGFGALPLYTLGVAYLDEIAGPQTFHIFIGCLYACAALGPALGFLLGSLFLSQYVDLGVTDHPVETNPNFVGRWWAGYVLSGILSLIVCIPLLLYPKQIPGTAWVMEEKRKKQKGTGKSTGTGHPAFGQASGAEADGGAAQPAQGAVARLLRVLKDLLVMLKLVFCMVLTPVLITNTMGATTEAFAVSGLIPFVTKIFQTQFGVTSSTASLLTGACSLVGIVGGILFSSWLMRYRKVKGARLAKYTAVIALIAAFFIPGFFLYCETKPIVGATQPYLNSTITGSNRCYSNPNDTCFASCGCVSERYDPVCGADGFTYPTPCLAGCQITQNSSVVKDDDKVFSDCKCVAANIDTAMQNATATAGSCKISSCGLLAPYIILLICVMFFTFMNNVPAIEVLLQSVPADRRTLATGVQWVVIRCVGNIPGPVFYGYLLDKGCRLWQLTCCKQGNCWEYDNANMAKSMFGATFACKSLSFLFFFLSWRLFVRDDMRKKRKDEESGTSGEVMKSEENEVPSHTTTCSRSD